MKMNVEDYLSRSRLFRRLKSGPHGHLVENYAARLIEEGLVRDGTWRCLNVVGGLLSWMASRRYELGKLDEHMADRYLRYRARRQSIKPGDRAAPKSLCRRVFVREPAPHVGFATSSTITSIAK